METRYIKGVFILKNINLLIFLSILSANWSCSTASNEIQTIALFKGQQLTGVTVSNEGRIFVNFPRWREGVENSVAEISQNGESQSFPNANWNSWELGDPISDSLFVAVQSVVAFENTLYVLDTRNPLFQGVIDPPKIYAFDLQSKQLLRIYQLNTDCYYPDSYINDLRVDKKKGKIYFTDSGHGGLLVLDIKTAECFRVLDKHPSTMAETDHLNFSNGRWENRVHSDGIALDTLNNRLYYHALTAFGLYSIATEDLLLEDPKLIEKSVKHHGNTPAPDGMIIDASGHLYLADLEKDKIMRMDLSSGEMVVLAEGDQIKWADSFSIYNNELYYTNSRINEAQGDISEMTFSLNKVSLNSK